MVIQLQAELSSCTHLVWTETLQRVVGELVAHVHQVVVGVDVVQTVGFGLSRGLAHVLAIPKQTVEVELVGVLTISSQTGITARKKKYDRRYGLVKILATQGTTKFTAML